MKIIANLKRDILLNFKVNEAERDLITEKMAQAGISNKGAYLRKMSIDGYVIRLDLSDVRKMVWLLSNATKNINQIAKRANELHSIFKGDIEDLQDDYERLWEQADAILRMLANIQK